jgi:transposase
LFLIFQEIKEMCDLAGVQLEYLPPYSPDFNPIEETFAELKAWMKRNYLLADTFDTFEGFLELGLRQMSQNPGNHFRSCHIAM